jgi:hypothetical protein
MVAGSFAVRATVKLLLKVLLLGLAVVTGAVVSAAGVVAEEAEEVLALLPASGSHSKLFPQPAKSNSTNDKSAAFTKDFTENSSTSLNMITLNDK